MDNKVAGIILVILAVVYGVSEWLDRPVDRTFDPQIIQLDPQSVTEIEILPGKGQPPLRITSEGGNWFVTQSEIQAKADQQRVDALLESVKNVTGLRYVSKNPDQWDQYEVGESATRVRIKSNDEVLTDFKVGRFAFNQQTRSGTSYVRLEGQDGVVAVEGFLSLGFPAEIDGYRDKSIWSVEEEKIKRLEWLPSEIALAQDGGNNWLLNGVEVDSSRASSYLAGISTLKANQFYYGDLPQNEVSLFTMQTQSDRMVVKAGEGDNSKLVLNIDNGVNSFMVLDQDSAIYKKLNLLQLNEQ